jgi:hypothetical protein
LGCEISDMRKNWGNRNSSGENGKAVPLQAWGGPEGKGKAVPLQAWVAQRVKVKQSRYRP